MQNCNFAWCGVWVLNLVSPVKGRTWTDTVLEGVAEENMWTSEGVNKRKLEEVA
jgi:hypothetical protein